VRQQRDISSISLRSLARATSPLPGEELLNIPMVIESGLCGQELFPGIKVKRCGWGFGPTVERY
jgi:hypothetical protein